MSEFSFTQAETENGSAVLSTGAALVALPVAEPLTASEFEPKRLASQDGAGTERQGVAVTGDVGGGGAGAVIKGIGGGLVEGGDLFGRKSGGEELDVVD